MRSALALLLLGILCTPAWPHSASDAYLTLTTPSLGAVGQATLHGEWDIALRDLDFVLSLDDDGDGQITWGEAKHHQSAIEHYALTQLRFQDATGRDCPIKPSRFLIDRHADGAYVALMFDVMCRTATDQLSLRYSLFFGLDPSHRGIFVLHAGDATSTALLSPQNAQVRLSLKH